MQRRSDVISISMENTKMGPIPSFSLLPIDTCNPNAPCRCLNQCYALRLVKRRKNVRVSWTRNTNIVMSDLEKFRRQMNGWLAIYSPVAFRLHVGGDFCSVPYLITWLRIARENPDVKFFCFTKRYDLLTIILKQRTPIPIPKNMSITLSAWGAFLPPLELQERFPVAWLAFNGEDPEWFSTPINRGKVRRCEGHCHKCGMCFNSKRKDGDVMFAYN